jgi:hypothetical protein
MILAWALLQVALVSAAVQAMGRPAWRQAASVFALVAAMVLPLYLPIAALARAVLASLGLLAVVKVLQVAQAPERWPARLRAWHALVPFDVLATTRVRPRLDRQLLRCTAGHALLALAALAALWLLPRQLSLPLQGLRLLLGGVLVYTGMEALTEAIRLLHLLAGVAVPPLQERPIAALGIREFWARRWNRPVSIWLNEFVFVPVSRRAGGGWGLLAAFGTSALLHAWMFFIAAGWVAAIMAAAFFLFQALFVLVESAIRIRRLTPRMRRAWTLGMLGLSSPLFVEPALRVLGL